MSFIASLGDWLRKVTRSFASASISGQNITLTRHNGDTVVLTTQDTVNNAFTKIKLGTVTLEPDAVDDTLTLGVGAGIKLSANATNDSITVSGVEATQSVAGIMSTADKTKLDGIATGAEANQNAFSNVKVGSTTVAADSKTDTLELVAGNNVTITPDATNDKITIAATDTTYSNATTSAAGLMSKDDKTKLNGIATGAEVNQNAFSNVKVGSTTVVADSKTDTLELVAGTGITLTPDATNDKVTIKVTDNTYADASHTHPYIPTAGGDITGAITQTSTSTATLKFTDTTGRVTIGGGTAYNSGAFIWLYGKDHTSEPGCFDIDANNGTTYSRLHGTPDGTLTWKGESILNQNAFSNIKVSSTTIAADSKTDTLELVAGAGITLTPDATNDKVTIKVTDNTYASASHAHDNYVLKTGDTMTGMLVVPAIRSQSSGNVKTKATGGYTGLVIKDASASADRTPNNGMVIEIYKNNPNYAGQLFLGDNSSQGLYWNGWSSGTYGVWKKFIMTSDATYTVGSATKPVYVNNGAVAACKNDAYYPSSTDISLDGVSLGYVTASQKEVQFLFPLALLAPGSVKSCTITSVTMHTVNGTKTFSSGFTVSYAQLWTATGVIIRLVFTASTGISNNTPLTIACSGNLQFN